MKFMGGPMHEDIHYISMGPYKPMHPVTETWCMLFFLIHMTNLHVGSTVKASTGLDSTTCTKSELVAST